MNFGVLHRLGVRYESYVQKNKTKPTLIVVDEESWKRIKIEIEFKMWDKQNYLLMDENIPHTYCGVTCISSRQLPNETIFIK